MATTTAGRIRESLHTRLSQVEEIGQVHLYERFDGDWERFLNLYQYTVPGTGRKTIRGWEITQAGAEGNVSLINRLPQKAGLQTQSRPYVFVVTGIQKVEDARASELEWEELVERVQNTLDATAWRTSLSDAGIAAWSEPSQKAEWSRRPVGSTLCHYVRLLIAVAAPRTVA